MINSLPAIPMRTGHTWDDIHWRENTRLALQEIINISSSQPFRNNPRIKGKQLHFRFLFEGEDIDRKWIATALLGKEAGKTVYRVDLGKATSDYIGETEKNITALIAATDPMTSILFFDEADGLFGNVPGERQLTAEPAFPRDNLLKLTDSFMGTIIFSLRSANKMDQVLQGRIHSSVSF